MNQKYYIISLNHTGKKNAHICLWKSDNAGYCYSRDLAGVYDGYKKGYHDTRGSAMPVKKETLDGLFIDAVCDEKGTIKKRVPNCVQVWDVLGLVMTSNGLRVDGTKKVEVE